MKTLVLVLATLGLLFVTACEDDSTEPPPLAPEDVALDLTERWHVLSNIEYAYKFRRPDVYDDLLNTDFLFYLYSDGGGLPETWNRGEDLEATQRLFLSNKQTQNPPPDPVCTRMLLDLVFDVNTITWLEVHPPAFPTETWYTVTVFYTFMFEVAPNTTFLAQNGAKVEFVVRNTGTEQEPRWELVECHDHGSTLARQTMVGSESTWSDIKALYAPGS